MFVGKNVNCIKWQGFQKDIAKNLGTLAACGFIYHKWYPETQWEVSFSNLLFFFSNDASHVYCSLYAFIYAFSATVKPHRHRKKSNLNGQLARIIETDNGIIKTHEMCNLLRRIVGTYMSLGDISSENRY